MTHHTQPGRRPGLAPTNDDALTGHGEGAKNQNTQTEYTYTRLPSEGMAIGMLVEMVDDGDAKCGKCGIRFIGETSDVGSLHTISPSPGVFYATLLCHECCDTYEGGKDDGQAVFMFPPGGMQ